MIRPRDPAILTPTLTYGPYVPHEACSRLLQLAYRDCYSVLDLTYSSGGFWREPMPPGITLTRNNYDMSADADMHVDFTDTKLKGKAYDLVVIDPPHVADGGIDGIMAGRFGTVTGTDNLKHLIQAGFIEACRLARKGVLVKVTDHSHGGKWLSLSDWIKQMTLGANQYAPLGGPFLYCAMHTYRATYINDPKWGTQRVPRSNGATYLAFRMDNPNHRDFDAEYERQEMQESGR